MTKATTTIQIPIELAPKFEAWGKLTTELFGTLRRSAGLPPDGVPTDQAWFWTKEWQAKEKQADEDIASGNTVTFKNMRDAIKYLHKQA